MLTTIKSEEQYDFALSRVYDLMQLELEKNSSESIELDELTILVEAYEKEHYPIPLPRSRQ